MNRHKIISVHTLVKNEARFIWYSIMSIYRHVDRIRIWDMGSTDHTRAIIDKILDQPDSPGKVYYEDALMSDFDEEHARNHMLQQTPASEIYTDENLYPWTREKMLQATSADWFMVVDADEIWWEDSIKKVVALIQEKGDQLESIVVPSILPVGDIFHRQEERAGKYRLAGKMGHFALRAINRRIPGLGTRGRHGVFGWVDGEGRMIQERDPKKIGYVDSPYLHVTHLPRAGDISKESDVLKRKMKRKYELGSPFPNDFYFPEVFFREKPSIVSSPWNVMSTPFKFVAFFETPLRKIKRRIWKGGVGY